MNLVLDTQVNEDSNRGKKIKQEKQIRDEAVRHPLIADAIEIFNGDIVDVKVLQEE
jgi:hypothetical protein